MAEDREPDFSSSFLYEESSPNAAGPPPTAFSADAAWDCAGCPPPYFDLPPPPRPPFMDVDSCSASPYEVCDTPLIIDSAAHLENDLLNVLVVVGCAVLLVAVVLVAACVIWR